ncbi:cyclin H, partial [Phenoliferia sp. Uapishka_3]
MAIPTSSATSKTPRTPIPLFIQSSQYRNWRYSKEGLERVRKELNVTAVGRVRSMVEEERVEEERVHLPEASTSAPPPPSEIEYLTVSDELSLVTYYIQQVAALCAAFGFPVMVQATAMTYLKRFYLRNTCMDYHPKNVMLTCVFLATKTENHPISIDSFSGKIKSKPEDILSLEFLVSQSLRFEYKVHHAHLAAYGLSLDLQTTEPDSDLVSETDSKAQSFIRHSRLTDAEFIYTPSQIALASFRLANPTIVDTWIGTKESRRLGRGKEVERDEDLAHDELLKCLEEIGEMIQMAIKNPVAKEAVKAVDQRLKWARNPEKDPNSALFKKRQAEEEADREEKALAKAAKRPTLDQNVFIYNGTGLPPNRCPQVDSPYGTQTLAEDCLYLTLVHVLQANQQSLAHLPLTSTIQYLYAAWFIAFELTCLRLGQSAFQIHGGSYTVGSTTNPGLDGGVMAASQNMIVITIQYRLGILGFLKNDDLGISGNFGLKDIICALKFIQTEIANFGGNKASVTLAGQSSGAEMVKTLLMTPSASSLFARTILHSPPLNYGDQPPAVGNAVGAYIAQDLNCTNIACMRLANVSDILVTQLKLFNLGFPDADEYIPGVEVAEPIKTVIDGTLVTGSFGGATRTPVSGRSALNPSNKPMILTSVRDEACSIIYSVNGFPAFLFAGGLESFLELNSLSAPIAASIVASKLYQPATSDADAARATYSTIASDQIWTCPIQQTAVNLTVSVMAPIYLAQFNLGIKYSNPSPAECVGKVDHEDDIYAVFGTSPTPLSASQQTMQKDLQARWSAFAHTGNPNPTSNPIPHWNAVASATNLNLLIFGGAANGAGITAATQRAAQCQVGNGFWGRIVPFDEQNDLNA